MTNWFTKHPESLGETYAQHLCIAHYYAFKLFLCAVSVLIHGVFPFLFVHTMSKGLVNICKSMLGRR